MPMQHGPFDFKHYNATSLSRPSYVVAVQGEIDAWVLLPTLLRRSKISLKLYKIFPCTRSFIYDSKNHTMNPNFKTPGRHWSTLIEIGDLVNEPATILHQWSVDLWLSSTSYLYGISLVPGNHPKIKLHRQSHQQITACFRITMSVFYFRRSPRKALINRRAPFFDPRCEQPMFVRKRRTKTTDDYKRNRRWRYHNTIA